MWVHCGLQAGQVGARGGLWAGMLLTGPPVLAVLRDVTQPSALLQTNTNYSQEKHRCEYLHSKLAHIKRLIAEYDQRQLQAWP